MSERKLREQEKLHVYEPLTLVGDNWSGSVPPFYLWRKDS
jgi:hypothetical protein